MRASSFSAVGLILLTTNGCGDNQPLIATQVSFRVNFLQERLETIYDIHPDYAMQAARSVDFEDFGRVALNWNEEEQKATVSTRIQASPDYLSRSWPTREILSLPNGREFPRQVDGRALQLWKSEDDARFSLLYTERDPFVFGGGLQAQSFNKLPRWSRATQLYEDTRGEVRATLSLIGPGDEDGGIYFLTHAGMNPFREELESLGYDGADDQEVTITLHPVGKLVWETSFLSSLRYFSYNLDFYKLIRQLELDLQYANH